MLGTSRRILGSRSEIIRKEGGSWALEVKLSGLKGRIMASGEWILGPDPKILPVDPRIHLQTLRFLL